jgi:hypothetical protein
MKLIWHVCHKAVRFPQPLTTRLVTDRPTVPLSLAALVALEWVSNPGKTNCRFSASHDRLDIF